MIFLNNLSVKLRLTILFILIFSGSLAIFSYFLFLERSENRINEFDANLYNYAIDIAESLDIDSYGAVEFDPSIIKINEKIFPFSLGKSYISVFDINNKIVAHSHNVDSNLPVSFSDIEISKILKKGVYYTTIKSKNGLSFRSIGYLLPVLKIDSPLILHILVPLTIVENGNAKLKNILIFSQGIILILSGFMGYFFVGRLLNPIVEITNKAKQIEVRNLKEKVPVPESKDEIYELADTINHLFERLSLAFEFQERFVQDASHQLKTPLAIIKGELELFNPNNRSDDEINIFINSMSQEINSLISLTNNLLILARVDSGESNISLKLLSIEDLILNQVSRLSKLASNKKISINIDFDESGMDDLSLTKIYADEDLIGILIYNFLENAIKYSPIGTEIIVRTKLSSTTILFSVIDNGPGIKAGLEQKIFDRFYRIDGKSKESGSGLGLAICDSVAKLHNSKIWANNNLNGGSTFNFEIKNAKNVI